MSLPLEDEIMDAIGFGTHYNWYNGSRSCGGRRRDAIQRLSAAIKEKYEAGEEIAEPNQRAINTCWDANRKDQQIAGDATLTKTWQACANVIRWHMDQYHKRAKVAQMDNAI